MAEDSLLWTTGGAGDGAATFTRADWADLFRRLFTGTPASEGVLKNYLNTLAVSGTSSPVAVASGAAVVDGIHYVNTASVNVAIATPAGSTRVDRIVLRADWTAQTVRITRIAGTEGAGTPAMTQNSGTTYDVPLATVSITTGGVITVTDARTYVHPNIEVNTAMVQDSAVTAAKLASDAVTTAKILDANVTAGKLASDAVTTAKILDANVTAAKLAAAVAGDGLAGGAGTALSVNVDGSTLEISSDALRVKDGGITAAKIANRTRTLWIPAQSGVGALANPWNAQGLLLVDGSTYHAGGSFVVPSDYVSGGTLKPVVFSVGASGNVRLYMKWIRGPLGGSPLASNSEQTEANFALVITTLAEPFTLAAPSSLAAGDYCSMDFYRAAGNAGDTLNDDMYILGFAFTYTADS